MKEYIEREAVLTLVEPDARPFLAERIKQLPAADVQPVVRCCDCKHFQVNVSPSGYLPQCVPEWECRYWLRPTDPTDFCSYGEKREES